ncbi:hypothetical protein C0993_004145 [Termitomyces sp. T159_Od127]|nr:hypothetical protein C0993_004145 [Termitomyces sp. T159_Od127]
MRITTWNLRFDSMPDNITVQQTLDSLQDPLLQPTFLTLTEEQPWSTRRIKVAEQLLSSGISLASNTKVKLLSNDSFWLSNTPFEPSKFPGAGSVRICTAAHFSTLSSNGEEKNFTLLNTHLDDQSDAQRRLGASMLLTRARFEAVNTNNPVFITGDFNRYGIRTEDPLHQLIVNRSAAMGSDPRAYNIITGVIPPVAINATFAAKYHVDDDQLPSFTMLDLRGQAPRRSVSTNFATFTGFTAPNDTTQWTRIDFIFGGSNGKWQVQSSLLGPC